MRGLNTRILTALIFGAILIPCLVWTPGSAQLVFAVILFLMQYEYSRTVYATESTALSWILLSVFVSFAPLVFWYLGRIDSSHFIPLLWISVLYVLLNCIWLLSGRRVALSRQPYLFQGLFYIGLPILLLAHHFDQRANFGWIVLGIFFLIWISDSGAYFVGSKWGRRPLFARVSPKKTWEGTIGGTILTLIAALPIALAIGELSIGTWFLMALAVVLFGTLGDLIESAFKRYFGIKDSGNMLPGHGGFLDRFDSFISIVPIALLLIHYMS